jgi:peptidylprolyl isomerase
MRRLWSIAAAVILAVPFQTVLDSQAKPKPAGTPAPVLIINTANKGVIEIETFPADAPKSVERIVSLAKSGFYRSQRWHWVQPAVIQMGDQLSRVMTKRLSWGSGGSGLNQSPRPIGVAEISKRQFVRGIVGYAWRVGYKPEDADSQFFIMKVANPAMNGKYAAIGRVIKGMDVVDKIALDDEVKDITVR